MGDRRVGEHLKKLDVGWRTAGDFKAGTVGVTSACLKDDLDLLEEFSRRVESTAGS